MSDPYFGPPDSWYQPPEPVVCCARAEDGDHECPGCAEPLDADGVCPDCGLRAVEHDSERCLADQAEDAAERRAERDREDEYLARHDPYC
jgi:predicted amidophosphoribosyltransferase